MIAQAIYKTLDFLRRRKLNYQLTFTSPAGQYVMHDLAKFCRAHESAWNADPRVHAAMEGRREVWLRIEQHLNLSSEKLLALYNGQIFNPNSGEDNG